MDRRVLLTMGLLASLLLSGRCDPSLSELSVSLTLNAVSDDLNDLLVVPPSGFAINAVVTQAGLPVTLASLNLRAYPWSGDLSIDLTSEIVLTVGGAHAIVPPALALAPGSYTLVGVAEDPTGDQAAASLSIAVRDHPNGPPIGTGQTIWYDFGVDRDGDTNPDFPVDLQQFGLGSTADPTLSVAVEALVIQAVLDRVSVAYHEADPVGLGAVDPVAVSFATSDPGGVDVTQICIGGGVAGAPGMVGNILIDPQNGNRSSVECGSLPPTGIFPAGLLGFAGDGDFQNAFDPLMANRGGTPVGENPLDPIVLDPGFDPGSATVSELQRHLEISDAIQTFADVLGTIVAHETGHALGLVAPGSPGGGLYGGATGVNANHNVTSDGQTVPPVAHLMNAGPSFSFAELAGLAGNVLPDFRPLNHAYLRDRVVQDPAVTELLPPPVVSAVSPMVFPPGATFVTVTGQNFAATPKLRISDASSTWDLFGESFVSSEEMTAFAVNTSIPPGTYTLELENADGQLTLALDIPIVVQGQ